MIAAIMTSFIVSTGLSLLLAKSRGRWQILDIPNERSLHDQPIPRTGGIAILTGLAAGLLTAWYLDGQQLATWPALLSVCLLAGIALVDDRHTLGAGPRLLVQISAVALLLLTREAPLPGTLIPVAAGLFLVWMINLYNFMDGMDGFAGGMAVIGFATFGLAAWQAGDATLALGCGVVVAATAGFLLLNFPPARLFMGDSGSTVLGLLAGLLILSAHTRGVLPVWLGILVFSPFIVDASITLGRRLLRGERVWEAHKSHYYQRLVELDWGHRRTVLAEYVLMAACGISALVALRLSTPWQTTIIAVWAVIYVTLMYRIHRAEQRRDMHS
jgi:UDP-N-acetylmuramyl pentapeptide phosphotransferase/UDP-N-acetylglucosamine-1-phosphate transferase